MMLPGSFIYLKQDTQLQHVFSALPNDVYQISKDMNRDKHNTIPATKALHCASVYVFYILPLMVSLKIYFKF